ncbi:MAG TPA: Calx-beta domain-containing protein [Gaiellaceae bacterium]|nr:Calx-beta domain-containing protein [Gaiellaceae bacterium]
MLVAACLVALSAAEAGHVVGTSRADHLVGTPRGDHLDGRGGNDVLVGLGGNDVLVGGPGNDRLLGGPGSDVLDCGPGKDVAVADARDTIMPGCEGVQGILKPALSIADASAAEGSTGTTALSFAVTLSASTPLPVSVRFATSDGTATTPSDYAMASGVLTFKPRKRRKVVSVAVVGDKAFEQDETFTITLSSAVNATVADGSATGTIANDDPLPARPGVYGEHKSSPGLRDFEAFGFAVLEDGQTVGRFGFTFVADCQPEGTFMISVTASSAVIAIGPDKRFSLDAKGEGTTELKVTGTFDASGTSASGSVQAHLGFTSEGSHYECGSGERTWAARWLQPLLDLRGTVGDTGNLILAFDEIPITAPSVSYKLDANASATWACSGGQTIDTQAPATNTVTGLIPEKNGRVHASIELAAPTPPSACAGAVLRRVDYTNVRFTNLTTGFSTFTGPFGRTFP